MSIWDGYCLFCGRLRSVLLEAPWANFDLIASAILVGSGSYLLASPTMFDRYGGVYHTLAQFSDEWVWGAMFLLGGVLSFLIVCWPIRPPFLFRLTARMMAAFCLTSFALNNLSSTPPPVSTVTYSVLALSALWAVLRTRNGRY